MAGELFGYFTLASAIIYTLTQQIIRPFQ